VPASWCRLEDGGARWVLTLHVQPGARRTEAAGLHGDALRLRLAAPPVDGKANAELIRFLAEAFDVPRRSVSLISGETSRRKQVAVTGSARLPQALLDGTGDEPRRRGELKEGVTAKDAKDAKE
jgi:uncharacterized protein (TIGR00251 family)